jgi:hypothetical protein
VVLVIGCAVQHAIDLQDVTVAVVAVELVARPVEAEHQLTRPSGFWRL